jgi:hypothetical protein
LASVSHRGRRNSIGLVVNAADFGVLPAATAAANTAAMQRAIDTVNAAGRGEVYVPDGTYTFARTGSTGYCLLLKSGVAIVGESQEGTILQQAASMAASIRLFYFTNAVGASIRDVTLDGNKASQTVSEHRHGTFIDGADDLTIERVTSQNFTGDGFYVYLDANDVLFRNCTAVDNVRSGITIGRECSNIQIRGCTLLDNGQQEIDFEPAETDHVSGVVIRGNTIGNPDGSDNVDSYVVAIGGSSSDGMTSDVELVGNTIYGSVFVVWGEDITIKSNQIIVADGETPCIKVYRNCVGVDILNNDMQLTRTAHSANEAVILYVDATSVGNQPDGVLIADNRMTMTTPCTTGPTCGIVARGALNLTIEGNTIEGAGGTAGSGYDGGVLMRANVASTSWVVRNNRISNIGTVGVKVYDTLAVGSVTVDENTFSDTQGTPTMVTGVDLYDGSENIAVISCADNAFGDGIATDIDFPPNVPVKVTYTHEGFPVYTGEAVPSFTADDETIYIRVNTSGVVIGTYERRSAAWVLVS